MIDRYDFWARPLTLRRMMDRLFEDAFVLPGGGQPTDASHRAMNVYEEGDNLVLEAHLPGFKPDDIDVSVDGGILTIRCQAKADEEPKERSYFVRQHRTSSFAWSLRLPDSVDVDAARATFEHGVLRLAFPKAEPARPRRVPIATGGQASIGAAPSAQSGNEAFAPAIQPANEAFAPTAQPSAESPAPSVEPAGDLPAHHNGEATNGADSSTSSTAGKAAQGGKAGGKAPRRKAAEGKGTGRKAAAKEPVGAGA